MIVYFSKKLHLFRAVTFKHGIINNQNVGTLCQIQSNNRIFYDSTGKNGGKANSVDLEHFHKAVNSVFGKIRSVPASKKIHIYASIRENQKKQIL